MIDPYLLPLTRKLLHGPAAVLVKLGITANQVTIGGFIIGMLALPALAMQWYGPALVFILLNRLSDGLDGAVARQTKMSDAGGFLDIVLDFIFYNAVVVGFFLADPGQNAMAAVLLLFSFAGTGSSFLAFASVAAKYGLSNVNYPNKSLHYMGGLTEGFETIAVFVAFCLWPQHFVILAYVFAGACWITTLTRLRLGYLTLTKQASTQAREQI
ncbi:CDP-alcohol phosphatidyltransferase family protein [Idiomarina seosinensis]|uniref:CDP-alcohol phosphatidyltransferase family protein n=1 Tax=Idiomarina seosinensis TaxID=281739 RepID=UPI00384B3C29